MVATYQIPFHFILMNGNIYPDPKNLFCLVIHLFMYSFIYYHVDKFVIIPLEPRNTDFYLR